MQPTILKHIGGTVKGIRLNHELGSKTLIIGPNYAGKTTILDAVRLLILGYLPEIGQKPGITFQRLSFGGELDVFGTFSDGGTIQREWKMKGKEVARKSNVPDDFNANIPLISREYFDLSDSERVNYVFGRVPMPEGYEEGRVIEEIESITADSDDVTSDDEDAVGQVVAWWLHERAKHPTLNAALLAMTAEKGKLATEYTTYNRDANASKGAVQVMVSLEQRQSEVSVETLAELKAEQARLEGLLQAASEEYGSLKAKRQQASAHVQRKAYLNAELAKPGRDYDAEVSRVKRELEKLVLKEWNAEKYEEDEKKRDALTKEIVPLENDLKDIANQQAVTETELTRLKESGHVGDSGWGCGCDHCQEVFTRTKDGKITALKKTLGVLTKAEQKTCREIDKRKREIAALDAAIAAVQAIFQLNAETTERRTALTEELEDLETARKTDETDRTRMSEELERIKDLNLENATDEEIRKHEDKYVLLRDQIAEVKEKIDNANDLAANIRNAKKALDQHKRAKSYSVIIAAAKKKLIALQSEMVGKVFGGITSKANEMLCDLLPSPLDYVEPDIGRWNGEKFVTHHTFSGLEKGLTYVSIAAALSAQSPLRILLLDEMGVFTPQMQGAVLKRLAAAVDRGDIDQVICAIPRDTPIAAPADWNLISLF